MVARIVPYLLAFALGGGGLLAQDLPRFVPPGERGDLQYHFQLRANRSGAGVRELSGSQIAGGGGFMAMFGEMPLRVRIRMDGDLYSADSGKQLVRTAGFGMEGVLLFPAADSLEAFVSLGPALQHWEIGADATPNTPKRSFNKAAGRLEAGLWFRGRFGLSAGILAGALENGLSARNAYAAVTFRF